MKDPSTFVVHLPTNSVFPFGVSLQASITPLCPYLSPSLTTSSGVLRLSDLTIRDTPPLSPQPELVYVVDSCQHDLGTKELLSSAGPSVYTLPIK